MTSVDHVIISMLLSFIGGLVAIRLIKEFMPILIRVNLYGVDQCKPKSRQRKVPEPMGVIAATVYLMLMFVFIIFPFSSALLDADPSFPHNKFVEFVAGLLSICCMIFLGFADDVLDLPWRYKLLLPSLASMPLLMVYAANHNSTDILLPHPLSNLMSKNLFHLGLIYYVYLWMLAVFCTNSINILAGINGLEAGQSVLIGCSLVIFNFIQILRGDSQLYYHYLSIYFLMPYLGTSGALFYYNWYPAEVFVGDTFCYFSGMLFAVVAILGHFGKTLLLFFIPQIFNFIYSVPQLFHLIPCPRHRLPKYVEADDLLHPSRTRFKPSELSLLGYISFKLLLTFGLVKVEPVNQKKDDGWVECNNLTLINFVLIMFGPMHEAKLSSSILLIQVLCNFLAFLVRFWLAGFVYDVVR